MAGPEYRAAPAKIFKRVRRRRVNAWLLVAAMFASGVHSCSGLPRCKGVASWCQNWARNMNLGKRKASAKQETGLSHIESSVLTNLFTIQAERLAGGQLVLRSSATE
jgi:hypothetical protein